MSQAKALRLVIWVGRTMAVVAVSGIRPSCMLNVMVKAEARQPA